MDKASIIIGITRWVSKQFAAKLPPFSPALVAVSFVASLAERNPDAAIAVVGSYPQIAGLAAPFLSVGAEAFDDMAASFVKALREKGGMRVFVGQTPYIVSAEDAEQIVAEIRAANGERSGTAQ